MDSSWSYALDMSAASGLLDYDAAASITGQKARFVGNPQMSDIENKPLYLPKKLNFNKSPENDEFQNSSDDDGKMIRNPVWKKIVAATIIVGGIAASATALIMGKGKFKMPDFSKLKTAIKTPKFKMPKFSMPKMKMPKFSNIGTKLKNGATSIGNFIKKPFVALMKLFKK